MSARIFFNRMSNVLLASATKYCAHYDQSWMFTLFMIDITPNPHSITFSLRVVAPNSNKNPARCKPHFCNKVLSSPEVLL